MKTRNVLLLSFLALLLISLFQRAGVWFAYRNQMQKAEATLAACFKETFTLVTDAQVNRLPYPEGTVTHIVYAPDSLHLDIEDRQLHYAEQTSAVLQDGYGLPETSLDSLRLTLTAVLQREGVTGSIYIRKLDAATERTLQTSPASVPLPDKSIGVLTSPRALLHPQKGIAVEAIADLHYFDHPSNLLFPGLTFLITGLLIGAIALRIKVRDNGIGIPLNRQMKIFGKFERIASGSRATGASGFGLGLNFVWQVVQAHGGSIAVESREGSGSEFTVVLRPADKKTRP